MKEPIFDLKYIQGRDVYTTIFSGTEKECIEKMKEELTTGKYVNGKLFLKQQKNDTRK